MTSRALRRIQTAIKHLPSFLQGYNLYVNPEKLRLIEQVFGSVLSAARSFADLGGVWRVNAAYTMHTLKRFPGVHGVLVDTDFPTAIASRLSQVPGLRLVHGDFGRETTAEAVGEVDVIYLFDVLLHQANPDWDQVLAMYAKRVRCMVIYNQQFVAGDKTTRLSHLPLAEYMALTGGTRTEFFEYVFAHRDEMHPVYNKPWGDIHNLTQWGITDDDLRKTMADLSFREVYYRNHGSFVGLASLENHAYVFVR